MSKPNFTHRLSIGMVKFRPVMAAYDVAYYFLQVAASLYLLAERDPDLSPVLLLLKLASQVGEY